MAYIRDDKNGLENSFAGIGIFYMVTSILVSLLFFWLFKQTESSEFSYLFIIGGILLLVQGFILKTLFQGCAEVIRLLKRLNGLNYSGDISGDNNNDYCGNCGAYVSPIVKSCASCGSSFEEEEYVNDEEMKV